MSGEHQRSDANANDVHADSKHIDFSRTFKIIVGKLQAQKEFTAHDTFVLPRSPFFKAALKGEWKEAKERCVRLPEDDTDVVADYLHLVYIKEVPLKDGYPSGQWIPELRQGFSECWLSLTKLYVFAEKIQDVQAKEAIMNIMPCYSSHSNLNSDCLDIIYAELPEKSSFAPYWIDHYAHRGHAKWFEDDLLSEFPKGFLEDVTMALYKRVQRSVHPCTGLPSEYYKER